MFTKTLSGDGSSLLAAAAARARTAAKSGTRRAPTATTLSNAAVAIPSGDANGEN